jgi:hypothetical protein
VASLKSTSDSKNLDVSSESDNPFSTIESAQDFVKLLTKAIREAKQELEALAEREPASEVSRRLDALRISLYSVSKLEVHMHHSSRILNDLRTLRRLLLAERETTSNTVLDHRSTHNESTRNEALSNEDIEAQPSLNRLPL